MDPSTRQNEKGELVRVKEFVEILPKHMKKKKSSVDVHPLITNWFTDKNMDGSRPVGREWLEGFTGHIDFYTEYEREHVSYRAHPRYHMAPWNDWAMVRFEGHNVKPQSKTSIHYGPDFFPSKILAFFEHPVEEGKKMALIHSAGGILEDEYKGLSNLCEVWEMEYTEIDTKSKRPLRAPNIHCVEVDCLDVPVMMIEEKAGLQEIDQEITVSDKDIDKATKRLKNALSRRAVMIRPFEHWAKYFLGDHNE